MKNEPVPTPEEIWKILKETSMLQKKHELEKEDHEREMRESIRGIQNAFKKAEKIFTTQWGKLVESLVEGDLINLLNKKGIKVKRTSMNETGFMKYIDENGDPQERQCEIDIIGKNGKEIVVVEVKTTLRAKDVDRFLEVLKLFTEMLPEYKGNKVYGAVAYLREQDGSSVRAEKQGLFVIKATGNSSSIINKEKFKPKTFL